MRSRMPSLSLHCLTLQEDIPEHRHASVREVAVHISNHSMQVGDRGVVVMGASAELGDLGHLGSAGGHCQPLSELSLPDISRLTDHACHYRYPGDACARIWERGICSALM